MAKVIKYKFLTSTVNHGTDENPILEEKFIGKSLNWNEANEEIAKNEAHNGLYIIEEVQEIKAIPTAPHNITSGEYFTVAGVLYKATENIPNGGTVIEGQNAIATTVEEQLYELTRGD